MRYALREALAGFARTPILTLLSVMMIGLSLLVLGLFGVGTYNIRGVLDEIESRVEVVAYLRDEAGPEVAQLMVSDIEAFPEVESVIYISRNEALERAREEIPELRGLLSGEEANPLPASIEVRLLPGHRTPEIVGEVSERISGYPLVEETDYGKEWVERIHLLRRIAAAAALTVGGAFALVATLIIGAAIRMTIFARREEIEIMRLVGATNNFIRLPFLLEGFLTGLLGSGLALGATYLIYRILGERVFPLAWLPDEWVIYGVTAGALLGLTASGLAVRHHLRQP